MPLPLQNLGVCMTSKIKHVPLPKYDVEQLAKKLAEGYPIRLHGLDISHHCDRSYVLRVISRMPSRYNEASYFWFTPTLSGRWDPPTVTRARVLKYHLSVLEFLNQTPQLIQETHTKLRSSCVYYFRPVKSPR